MSAQCLHLEKMMALGRAAFSFLLNFFFTYFYVRVYMGAYVSVCTSMGRPENDRSVALAVLELTL